MPTLDGIEQIEDLVNAMDLQRLAQNDRSVIDPQLKQGGFRKVMRKRSCD